MREDRVGMMKEKRGRVRMDTGFAGARTAYIIPWAAGSKGTGERHVLAARARRDREAEGAAGPVETTRGHAERGKKGRKSTRARNLRNHAQTQRQGMPLPLHPAILSGIHSQLDLHWNTEESRRTQVSGVARSAPVPRCPPRLPRRPPQPPEHPSTRPRGLQRPQELSKRLGAPLARGSCSNPRRVGPKSADPLRVSKR
eukprot:9487053-Pyramimonas_sp.AAC.1